MGKEHVTGVSLAAWRTQGDGRPRSALYGIWEVVELTIDGVPTAPAAADYDQRWRRVIFDAPDEVVIQRLDDSVAHYAAAIDPAGRTLLLSRGRGARWRSRLQRPIPCELLIQADSARCAASMRAMLTASAGFENADRCISSDPGGIRQDATSDFSACHGQCLIL